ncbi:hypothetical protein RCOM_1731940 [Ricinus communis]|uniref:Myb-like domain-containing protein n=1 Tax=Ricinus communis TaxID=3988 RepID=B9S882_RICCO|nr:hypothetical protein RCOM_1731940 [Ricinus communis]
MEISTLPENSRSGAAATGNRENEENEERVKVEEADRYLMGNRWPRQETLALLKIRSDMDFAFREAALKAPLWDEVSRKLSELGYNRSAKKCKEKFENIYKYHRRTKEGRSGKANCKSYRFFEQLEALDNHQQESLQRKFLDAIEKCEQDRMAREEAWKMQELDRIKRERELLVQERSIAAAKDAAVLSILQKFSDQASSVQLPENQIVQVQPTENQVVSIEKVVKAQENNNVENYVQLGSTRWPKEEIEALIRLRTNLDIQYQDSGPKGPLWEEISAAMKKLGYNRNAKRCKEKWENMNKYFKRVKESNKRRPDDAKTCPYFQQLDVLYRQKTRKVDKSVISGQELKPEELLMHMMVGQEERQQQGSATTEEGESLNVDQNQEDDRENDNEDNFRVVANDPSSVAMID